MSHYIEFIHHLGKSPKTKEMFASPINLKTVKHSVQVQGFSGLVRVYDDDKLVWTINCANGAFNGECCRYIDFIPSTLMGSLSGYLTFNWRQPILKITFRAGQFDGPFEVNKPDGSKYFLLKYSMGLLDGEQKHYTTSNTRILHVYEKSLYKSSTKVYKNWLPIWGVELNEFESHKLLKTQCDYNLKLITI